MSLVFKVAAPGTVPVKLVPDPTFPSHRVPEPLSEDVLERLRGDACSRNEVSNDRREWYVEDPISSIAVSEPAVSMNGACYNRASIVQWIETKKGDRVIDPFTNKPVVTKNQFYRAIGEPPLASTLARKIAPLLAPGVTSLRLSAATSKYSSSPNTVMISRPESGSELYRVTSDLAKDGGRHTDEQLVEWPAESVVQEALETLQLSIDSKLSVWFSVSVVTDDKTVDIQSISNDIVMQFAEKWKINTKKI